MSSWTKECSEKTEGYRQISGCLVFISKDVSSWSYQTLRLLAALQFSGNPSFFMWAFSEKLQFARAQTAFPWCGVVKHTKGIQHTECFNIFLQNSIVAQVIEAPEFWNSLASKYTWWSHCFNVCTTAAWKLLSFHQIVHINLNKDLEGILFVPTRFSQEKAGVMHLSCQDDCIKHWNEKSETSYLYYLSLYLIW